MIKLENIHKIYFIGIGGIGMSALARYFLSRKVDVSGYDKTATVLTRALEESGIPIHYEDNLSLIPKNADVVVYTPAIAKGQQELAYYQGSKIPVLKRSEMLGIISSGSFNICVAGTHGKTTISSMIAHILRHTGYGCNAFLGGIVSNYDTNFWSSERNVCVIEADEYDRSFLRLHPDIAVISAMDPDHLDIYGTEDAFQDAFVEFSGQVKSGGVLFSKFGLKRGKDLVADSKQSYSLQNESADIHARNIRMQDGTYQFDVVTKENLISNVTLKMGGMHNVENAVVAIAVALELGIDPDKIKDAVQEFRGVKRRFEYISKTPSLVYIDDYAHHPEELRALLNGAMTLFRESKCTLIFQPHLFSRTKDNLEEFAEVLSEADEVILLPIYPARELPIEGVNSELLLLKIDGSNKRVLSKEACLNYVKEKVIPEIDREFGQVLITAGAGDIDTLVNPIKEIIEKSM